jgi:nitrogen regulatory protein P-II 1
MKIIFAVIQPTKLRALKQALTNIGVNRITICDSQEFAKRMDREPVYRGLEYRASIMRKISLEIAVNDDFLERTISTIEKIARTGPGGNDGDGKIFVMSIDQAVSFEPEVRGPGAI